MSFRKGLTVWGALLALAIVAGAGGAYANHRWGCLQYADSSIYWYNGASGTYNTIFEEEARTDSDSWHNYTAIDLTPVYSPGTTDHINAYNGYYGSTNWVGLAEIITNNGCTVYEGRARLNQTYLENGYSRTNKEHVACHEVGHLFGLDHIESTTSCMDYHPLESPQPDAHDYELIDSIY